jgi:Co-chaperonin GroES (HSP10)
MLEGQPVIGMSLEPLDDHLVIEPLEDTETPSGLIVPVNEATQVRTGIVAPSAPTSPSSSPATRCSSRATWASRCASRARPTACTSSAAKT